MVLRFEPDVSPADWFAHKGDHWVQVCTIGPSGYEQYVRLFHPSDPDMGPGHAQELGYREGDLARETLELLVEVLAQHTTTPSDCYFCLWEGFGEISGGSATAVASASDCPDQDWSPSSEPAVFPPDVVEGPRVRIPARNYLLFRGALREAGDWGAAEWLPGVPREINSPNLMWPADHAWFVATEIDLPWTGIGGGSALIEALLEHEGLDTERVDPSAPLQYWRDGIGPDMGS